MIHRSKEREKERERDRQTEREADRQTDRQTDRKIDRRTVSKKKPILTNPFLARYPLTLALSDADKTLGQGDTF